MALQVERSGQLQECAPPLQVGDIIAEHGRIMRMETITVQDFILYAVSGGIPRHGYEKILIDEAFVTSSPNEEDKPIGLEHENGGALVEDGEDVVEDNDALPSIIGGEVTIIWVNAL